jgi:hypothetical protein
MISTAALVASDCPDVWRDAIRGPVVVRSTNGQSAVRGLQPKSSNDSAREYSNVRGLKSSHSSVSVSPHQSGEGRDDMHSPTSGRKLPLPDKTEVRDKLALAFSQAVPSAKHLARETGASVDTAEGWRGGINIPGGYNLIVLARQFPEVRAVVRQLIDCDFDQDPRAYALFLEAMRYAQGRGR